MNVQTTTAAAEPRHSYEGFVIAYVSHQGPIQIGYLGRYMGETPGGFVELTEACEIVAIMRATPQGVSRTVEGGCIESSPTRREVSCRPYARIHLDGLQDGERRMYQKVEQMAAEARASISYDAPRVLPVGGPPGGLVGANGAPLGGGK